MLIVNLAAAAVTAVLAVSSGRNMLQTISVANKNTLPGPAVSLLQPSDSTETVISKVQAMKRKELLELYFSSRGPNDMAEIQGEWDGCLLDNQSWIMVNIFEIWCFCLLGTYLKFCFYFFIKDGRDGTLDGSTVWNGSSLERKTIWDWDWTRSRREPILSSTIYHCRRG